MTSLRARRNMIAQLRVIGAIAAKDIGDALRNKTTLTMMIGVALLMLTAGALPLLLRSAGRQRMILFDGAYSEPLAAALREQDLLRISSSADAMEVRTSVGEASDAVVGITLPAEWPLAPAGAPLQVNGYVPYWIDDLQTANATDSATAALETALHRPVTLTLSATFPGQQPGGNPLMLGLSFVLVLFLVSIMLVPLLLIEERENHTLEVLLVSPASMMALALGKALAGLTFGLVAAAVYLVFNQAYIVHWGVVSLAVLVGAFFATSLGLLLGLLFKNQGTLNLWVGLVLICLLAPLFLGFVPGAPAALSSAAAWMPTTGLVRLFWLALTETVSGGELLPNLATVLPGTGLLLGIIFFRLRKLDR